MRCPTWFSASHIFATVLLLFVSSSGWAFSAIEVTNTSGAANVTDACTLRDAITAANTDTAVGGCPAGSGDDEIRLPEGAVITLNEVDNIRFGYNALPAVTSSIFIDGSGATIQRDPNLPCFPNEDADNDGNLLDDGEFRLFLVENGGELVLLDLTLAHACPDGRFPGDRSGGAVFIFTGSATIEDSTLRDHRAGAYGGALYRTGSGTTTVRFSQLINNEAVDNGGAVYSTGGTTIISSSLVDGNQSDGSGGGLYVSTGSLEVIDSTISNNSSEDNGGGIGTSNSFSDSLTTLTVLQSTISGNEAGAGDEGFPLPVPTGSRFTSGFGGGISSLGSLDIRHSTLVDNIANDYSALFFGLSVVDADTKTIESSILAGDGTLCGGRTLDTLIPQGENLSTDDSCPGFTLINTDPLLGPLADNGGPTPTHALLQDSPAIDAAGECPVELTVDQREFPRPGAGTTLCDLGAFEYQSPFIFSDRFER
jgi:predicted outer membrane repeat protein